MDFLLLFFCSFGVFFVFPVTEEIYLARSFVLIIFPDKPVTENPVTEYDCKTLQADFYENNLTSESSHTKTQLRYSRVHLQEQIKPWVFNRQVSCVLALSQ